MAVYEIASLFLNGITAISTLFISVATWLALSAWKSQLHGKVEFDLTRRIFVGVLSTKKLIGRIRAVVSIDNKNLLWERLDEVTTHLDVDLDEAEVICGTLLKDARKSLADCCKELRKAQRRYDQLQSGQGPKMADEKRSELQRECNATLLETLDSNDDFAQRVQYAVGHFESKLRPLLNPNRTKSEASKNN